MSHSAGHPEGPASSRTKLIVVSLSASRRTRSDAACETRLNGRRPWTIVFRILPTPARPVIDA
jgi:hypothetical protein